MKLAGFPKIICSIIRSQEVQLNTYRPRQQSTIFDRYAHFGYVDSDDSLHPRWLEEMDRAIRADSSRRLIMPNKNYRLQLMNDDGHIERVFLQKVLFGPQLTVDQLINLEVECDTNGLIHSRELGIEAGGWDLKINMYEDDDFLVRMLDRDADGFYFLPLVLADYTRSYGNDSPYVIKQRTTSLYRRWNTCLRNIRTPSFFRNTHIGILH